jgi:PAS domain S-box-containing protein
LESALAVIATAVAPSVPWLPRDSAIAQLLTHTRSIIVRLDEGEWSVLSEAVTPVLGYSPDLVPSLEPLSVIDPRDKYPALRAFVRTRTGRCRECIVDLRVRSADGSTVVLETVFADLTGAPGVQAVVAYGIDVTEQRAERARFRALVMRLGGAALVVDERGGLVLANDAFTQLFGTQVGGWGGEDCEAALCAVAARCRDPEIAHQHLVDLTSRRRRSTGRLDLVDGCILDLEQHPLAEEGIHLGSLWLFRDVTAEVATRAALERDSRAAAFALERQNRLLATVSHEFRTPLTALLSFAELLADPRLGALNETQRSAIEVITRNTERLLRLVDDLLLLTRLESKQLPLRFSEVDVPELVRAAVADRALEARARHVEITCEADEGPPLLADTGRLHQVLGNVLSNALKFGAGGGSIQVSAEFSASAWAIETADSGIGIPPDDLVRITHSFERGSNAVDAGISGSGLGLAVCREVVELHGGTLSIASVLNVGTTVRIVLPVEGGRQP